MQVVISKHAHQRAGRGLGFGYRRANCADISWGLAQGLPETGLSRWGLVAENIHCVPGAQGS